MPSRFELREIGGRRASHAQTVIASRHCQHRLSAGQAQQGVQRPAQLERAGALKALQLEPHVVERARALEWGAHDVRADALGGGANVFQAGHGQFMLWPLTVTRDFLKLWAGQTVSLVGTEVSQVAMPLLAVLVLGASPGEMGVLRAVTFAP